MGRYDIGCKILIVETASQLVVLGTHYLGLEIRRTIASGSHWAFTRSPPIHMVLHTAKRLWTQPCTGTLIDAQAPRPYDERCSKGGESYPGLPYGDLDTPEER